MKKIKLEIPPEPAFNAPEVIVKTFDSFVNYIETTTADGYVIAVDKKTKYVYFIMLDENFKGYDICVCNHIVNIPEIEVRLRYSNVRELEMLFKDFNVFSISSNEIADYFLQSKL